MMYKTPTFAEPQQCNRPSPVDILQGKIPRLYRKFTNFWILKIATDLHSNYTFINFFLSLEFRTPFFLIWSLPRLWYGSLSGSISLNHLSIFYNISCYNSLVLLTFGSTRFQVSEYPAWYIAEILLKVASKTKTLNPKIIII
jgi:hypothetical protein